MGKRIFWIFIFAVSLATMSVVLFVESNYFARFLKEKLDKNLSSKLGISLNFSKLSINMLPPGLAIVDPEINILRDENALGVPQLSVLKAKKLGITFQMLQALSGSIVINRLFLESGDVQLDLQHSRKGRTEGPTESEIDFLISMLSKPIQVDLDKN